MYAQLVVKQVVENGAPYEIEAFLFCTPKCGVKSSKFSMKDAMAVIDCDRRAHGSTDERPLILLNYVVAECGFKLAAFTEKREGIYEITRYILKEPSKKR